MSISSCEYKCLISSFSLSNLGSRNVIAGLYLRNPYKSQAVGMNASDYIRHLIVGYKPKEKPSEQFYEEIKNIRSIGNNINQIARIANAKGVVDVPHLKKEIDKLDEFIIDMKNKYLRPDKDE